MAQGDSNRVKIRFSTESSWGETVAGPATTELRITSESLAHNKETVVSGTIRSDRQRDSILEVANAAGGDLGFELAYADYETFFTNALRNTISSATVTDVAAVVAASTISYPTASTNFVGTFVPGQFVKLDGTGYGDDGAVVQLSAVASTLLTFIGTTLIASTISANVTGRTLVNGTTKSSMFIEADFTDLTAVKYFSGMRVGSMSLDVQSAQVITGVFSLIGKRGFTASVSQASTTVSAGTNTPMTAAANVLDIVENNARLNTIVSGFTLNVENNIRSRPQVKSKFSADPGDGGVDVTGNLTVYMEDKDLYDKMINHTATSLSMAMKDVDGNFIIVSMPTVYFATGDPVAGGIDQDVFVPLDWTAIRDSVEGVSIRFDFLPA